MSFTDPDATLVPHVGVEGTAALLNVWRADEEFLRGTQASVMVYRTADKTISGTTTIDWTSEQADTGGWHDNSTNPERLTVPTGFDGVIAYGVWVRMVPGGLTATVSVVKNGATTIARVARTTSASSSATFLGSIVQLVAADYLTVTIAGATPLDCDTAGIRPFFWAKWFARGIV